MAEAPAAGPGEAWLATMLERNAGCDWLRRHGAPRSVDAFRRQVPVVHHADLLPWIERMADGASDQLFAGRPVAWERTSGTTGAGVRARPYKLVPYSAEGLADFQALLAPWLARVVRRHHITGRVYLATSPATRPPEHIGGLPLGLPDGAYLGERWGGWVAQHSAVPLALAAETDVDAWRARTLQALRAADDLELISVWSPTFLLRLLDDIPDAARRWPRLKLVSCWADAASQGPARELAARLPQARLQPKGLMSTECVVTVPGRHVDGHDHDDEPAQDDDRPRLVPRGFFEFDTPRGLLRAHELAEGDEAELILTTASGLYRYRSGDRVRCEASSADDRAAGGPGRPVLRLLGRGALASDLVGEKLDEAFVAQALAPLPGWAFLVPNARGDGYCLVTDQPEAARAAPPWSPAGLAAMDERLQANPHYAHARRMRQLAPLALCPARPGLVERHARAQLARGTRLADAKPLALLPGGDWIEPLEPPPGAALCCAPAPADAARTGATRCR